MRLADAKPLEDFALEAPLPLPLQGEACSDPSTFSGVFQFAAPPLHLVALEGEATTTQLHGRRWPSLIFVTTGEVCLHVADVSLCCSPGDCLFIPERPAVWESSAFSVVSVMFSPQALRALVTTSRAQDLDWLPRVDWDFSTPTCRRADHGEVEACLLHTFRHLLQITADLELLQPLLLGRLGIWDQLCLLTSLLASPAVSRELLTEGGAKSGGAEEALDELTQYILNHLGEPMSLSRLENLSHYSRRSLQYAFQHQFGCTITQWIRGQRLDRAFQCLTAGSEGETVSSIAQACGYRSLSLFSIEFQNRFHIKPSVLLRQHRHTA